MAEIEQISFSFEEVATALIKAKGLHEGQWQVVINFGIAGANIGDDPQSLKPAAIVPVLSIGLARSPIESNLAVDAVRVNPLPETERRRASKKAAT